MYFNLNNKPLQLYIYCIAMIYDLMLPSSPHNPAHYKLPISAPMYNLQLLMIPWRPTLISLQC